MGRMPVFLKEDAWSGRIWKYSIDSLGDCIKYFNL